MIIGYTTQTRPLGRLISDRANVTWPPQGVESIALEMECPSRWDSAAEAETHESVSAQALRVLTNTRQVRGRNRHEARGQEEELACARDRRKPW